MSEFREFGLAEQIAAENLESHSKKLDDELLKIQLFYYDDLIVRGKNEGKGLSQLLKETGGTGIMNINALFRFEKSDEKEKNEEEFSKKLDALYAPENGSLDDKDKRAARLKAALDLFAEWEKDARARHPEEWAEHEADRAASMDKNRIGIYKYNLLKKENVHPRILEKMQEQGYSSNEEYFEIHLPASYENEEKVTPDNIKKYTAKLAELIVDEYPQARGVVGSSWLLDRAALRRYYGFKPVAEGKPNWLQFVGEDGQINAERVEELVQTGELPHKNIFAVVDTVDFLKKFLPPERRGEIKLKEVDPAWLEKYGSLRKEAEEEGQKFSAAWDDGALKTAPDVRKFMDALTHFKSVMVATGVYEPMVELLIANIGKSRRELYFNNKEFIEGFTKKTEEYYRELEKTKYREKTVTIN
jgi:hypothetical protein